MKTIFIADLHLSNQNFARTQAFLHFLLTKTTNTQELYILGDLFDFYAGDNAIDAYQMQIIEALRALSSYTKIFIMHGNRDFLIDEEFADLANVEIINDLSLIDLDGSKILLSHGDIFCSFDKKYQKFKKILRNPVSLFVLKQTPAFLKIFLAKQLRKLSKKANKEKSLNNQHLFELDLNLINQTMKQKQASVLINGHIHKHKYKQEDLYLHIVLPDWNKEAYFLVYENQQFNLESFNIA